MSNKKNYPALGGQLEIEFHKRLAKILSKRDQGYVMGAFREAFAEVAQSRDENVLTFDDEHLGFSDNGRRTVTSIVAARPPAMLKGHWYRMAGDLCKLVNGTTDAPARFAVDWMTCERLGDNKHVDEALRAFSEDSTQDNATGVIQAALTAHLADTLVLNPHLRTSSPEGS